MIGPQNESSQALKNLWAPWRYTYLKDVLSNLNNSCLFCALLAEDTDEKNLILRRNPQTYIIMNKYPYSNGHLLIIPNQHASNLQELSRDSQLEIMEQTTQVIEALKQWLRPEGFNVGMNLGRAAGAGIEEHLHVHVVPRWVGDTNFMPVISGTKVISQSLEEGWKQLKHILDG